MGVWAGQFADRPKAAGTGWRENERAQGGGVEEGSVCVCWVKGLGSAGRPVLSRVVDTRGRRHAVKAQLGRRRWDRWGAGEVALSLDRNRTRRAPIGRAAHRNEGLCTRASGGSAGSRRRESSFARSKQGAGRAGCRHPQVTSRQIQAEADGEVNDRPAPAPPSNMALRGEKKEWRWGF